MRGTSLAALLVLLVARAAAQNAGDSSVVTAPDRYVIDAAKVVRETGARTFADLLISQVPGLLVVQGSGLNGGGSRIRFAGVRSLVNDAPLILVDGFRVDAAEDASLLSLGGPGPLRLEDLSVEDVETIEVLRGPTSGAIYGPGAANGVILIHTKGGRTGPARWDTFAQGAFESVASRWPSNYGGVDTSNAFVQYRTGGCTLTAQAAGSCVQHYVQSFNPLAQQSPFATVLRRQVGFNGSGGPAWGAFRLSGTFDGDDGAYAVPGMARDLDRYSRWSLRGSGALHPIPDLDIGVSALRTSSDLQLPSYYPLQRALSGTSDATAFSWDSLFGTPGKQAVDRTFGSVQVRSTPLARLTIRGALAVDQVDQRDGVREPGQYRFDGRRRVRHNAAGLSASWRGSETRPIHLGLTLGVEKLGRRLEVNQAQGRDTTPLCSGPCALSWMRLERHSLAIYMTGDLAVRDRLVVTGALRRDRFEEFRLSVTNPSLAATWALGRARLHASYASASAPPPESMTFILVPFPYPSPLPPMRPDRTRSFEFGADAGFWGGKWTGRLAFYDARSDVGYLRPIASSSGYFYVFAGGAKVSNRGVEATLVGPLVDRPALGWDVRLSVWGNRNRLLDPGGPQFFIGNQVFQAGLPAGSYLANVIRSYADANGDGIITPLEVVTDSLLGWAGTPYPTQGAALTSAWRLGGRWRVSTTLEYRAGQTLFNEIAFIRCRIGVCRARNDPTTSLAEQAVAAAGPNAGTPTEYFEDADFLKMRALAVSFDVPAAASALGARAATITLVGHNLFTWTGYSGADPEAGSYPLPFYSGDGPSIADLGTLPPLRSWTLRVQLAY